MKKHGLTFFIGIAIWFGMAGNAFAGGCLLNPEQLPSDLRTQLEADIAVAKGQDSEPFTSMREAYSKSFEYAKRSRSGIPIFDIAMPKHEDLLPLIEILAFDEPQLPAPATEFMISGVFNALKKIDDDRARAIMKVVIDVDISGLVSGAVESFALKRDDSSVATILQYLSQSSGEKKIAVIQGMWLCRRLSCLQALIPELTALPDVDTAKQLAESIGVIGAISYWNSPVMASRNPYIDEGPQVRILVAQTLIAVYPKYSDETVREAILSGIVNVLHKRTPEFMDQAAQGQSAATVDALNELKVKYNRALNFDRQILRDKKYWDYAE